MAEGDALDLFKDLLWENVLVGALERLLVRIPFLGWGPITWIVTWLVGEFGQELYEALREWMDLQAIAIKKEELKNAWERSQVECRIVADSYGIDSPQFRKARDEHKASLSKFVRPSRAA